MHIYIRRHGAGGIGPGKKRRRITKCATISICQFLLQQLAAGRPVCFGKACHDIDCLLPIIFCATDFVLLWCYRSFQPPFSFCYLVSPLLLYRSISTRGVLGDTTTGTEEGSNREWVFYHDGQWILILSPFLLRCFISFSFIQMVY